MSIHSLTDLGARINEAHRLAMEHAGRAIEHVIVCGKMLLEAKAKLPHGKWLPWLRNNVTFGDAAQGYMRIAQRIPPQIRNGVSDFPSLRAALHALTTPRRHWRETIDADLEAWITHVRAVGASRPDNVEDWNIEDAKACADNIRHFDEIMHRHGICPWVDDPEPCCMVCAGSRE
jgi:hypothetical protein